MRTPILRATTEQGHVWNDPSEDLLFELLRDIERGNEQFIVVDRLHQSDGSHYMQAILESDGRFTVECREGGPDSHVSTITDLRSAHEAITRWAFGFADWRGSLAWRPVTYDDQLPT